MDNKAQREYWEHHIEQFDKAFYDSLNPGKRSLLSAFVASSRKKSIQQRFQFVTKFLEELSVKNRSFIDAGCGGGRLTEWLLKHGAARIYAVDITEKSIEIAKERIATTCPDISHKVEFHVGDITQITLPKADCFIGLGLVEYLDNLPAFLTNIAGNYRWVIVNYPLTFHWKRPIRLFVEYFEHSKRHYYSPEDMLKLFTKYGYTRRKNMPFGASILDFFETQSV